jgi:hypothetical protein
MTEQISRNLFYEIFGDGSRVLPRQATPSVPFFIERPRQYVRGARLQIESTDKDAITPQTALMTTTDIPIFLRAQDQINEPFTFPEVISENAMRMRKRGLGRTKLDSTELAFDSAWGRGKDQSTICRYDPKFEGRTPIAIRVPENTTDRALIYVKACEAFANFHPDLNTPNLREVIERGGSVQQTSIVGHLAAFIEGLLAIGGQSDRVGTKNELDLFRRCIVPSEVKLWNHNGTPQYDAAVKEIMECLQREINGDVMDKMSKTTALALYLLLPRVAVKDDAVSRIQQEMLALIDRVFLKLCETGTASLEEGKQANEHTPVTPAPGIEHSKVGIVAQVQAFVVHNEPGQNVVAFLLDNIMSESKEDVNDPALQPALKSYAVEIVTSLGLDLLDYDILAQSTMEEANASTRFTITNDVFTGALSMVHNDFPDDPEWQALGPALQAERFSQIAHEWVSAGGVTTQLNSDNEQRFHDSLSLLFADPKALDPQLGDHAAVIATAENVAKVMGHHEHNKLLREFGVSHAQGHASIGDHLIDVSGRAQKIRRAVAEGKEAKLSSEDQAFAAIYKKQQFNPDAVVPVSSYQTPASLGGIVKRSDTALLNRTESAEEDRRLIGTAAVLYFSTEDQASALAEKDAKGDDVNTTLMAIYFNKLEEAAIAVSVDNPRAASLWGYSHVARFAGRPLEGSDENYPQLNTYVSFVTELQKAAMSADAASSTPSIAMSDGDNFLNMKQVQQNTALSAEQQAALEREQKAYEADVRARKHAFDLEKQRIVSAQLAGEEKQQAMDEDVQTLPYAGANAGAQSQSHNSQSGAEKSVLVNESMDLVSVSSKKSSVFARGIAAGKKALKRKSQSPALSLSTPSKKSNKDLN